MQRLRRLCLRGYRFRQCMTGRGGSGRLATIGVLPQHVRPKRQAGRCSHIRPTLLSAQTPAETARLALMLTPWIWQKWEPGQTGSRACRFLCVWPRDGFDLVVRRRSRGLVRATQDADSVTSHVSDAYRCRHLAVPKNPQGGARKATRAQRLEQIGRDRRHRSWGDEPSVLTRRWGRSDPFHAGWRCIARVSSGSSCRASAASDSHVLPTGGRNNR